MHSPEIASFILCSKVTKEGRLGIQSVLYTIGLESIDTIVRIGFFFEVRLPAGMNRLVLEMAPEGGEPFFQKDVFSNPTAPGFLEVGDGVLEIGFPAPGWYVARLRHHSVSVERELCVWTPETRDALLSRLRA